MPLFSKMQSAFRLKREKESPPISVLPTSHSPKRRDPTDDNDEEIDLYQALTEVASPCPVEHPTDPEQERVRRRRRPSLDRELSSIGIPPPEDKPQLEIYRTLSEIASPEPVRRGEGEELARRLSLEHRLRGIPTH